MLGNISALEVTCEGQQLDSTISIKVLSPSIKVLSPVNSCFSIGVLWGCALCATWRLDLQKRVKTTGTAASQEAVNQPKEDRTVLCNKIISKMGQSQVICAQSFKKK